MSWLVISRLSFPRNFCGTFQHLLISNLLLGCFFGRDFISGIVWRDSGSFPIFSTFVLFANLMLKMFLILFFIVAASHHLHITCPICGKCLSSAFKIFRLCLIPECIQIYHINSFFLCIYPSMTLHLLLVGIQFSKCLWVSPVSFYVVV